MFHANASTAAPTSHETQAARGVSGEAWRWARMGREALGLLGRPLLACRQGIEGLEVSDSSFEEWEAVQVQFEARVRAGAVHML